MERASIRNTYRGKVQYSDVTIIQSSQVLRHIRFQSKQNNNKTISKQTKRTSVQKDASRWEMPARKANEFVAKSEEWKVKDGTSRVRECFSKLTIMEFLRWHGRRWRGGRRGDRPPTFMTQVLGPPPTLKKGPLITCKKKAISSVFRRKWC